MLNRISFHWCTKRHHRNCYLSFFPRKKFFDIFCRKITCSRNGTREALFLSYSFHLSITAHFRLKTSISAWPSLGRPSQIKLSLKRPIISRSILNRPGFRRLSLRRLSLGRPSQIKLSIKRPSISRSILNRPSFRRQSLGRQSLRRKVWEDRVPED